MADAKQVDAAVAVPTKKGFRQPDPREHLNVVFIGHVDAGKSTCCGRILVETGVIDARTVEKYERDAKEKNRDTWYLAFVMDINEDERIKGKTVEVGRAPFELPNKRFTILDAPGHRGFVPEMLSGASQADVGVLIISARKGEFEAGFERGGQTQEHALLAKTLGVNSMIVAVNKMDESTVNWDQSRYDMIVQKMTIFLKSCGFSYPRDVTFIPMSAQMGQNVQSHVSDPSSPCYEPRASWYPVTSPTLFTVLENTHPLPRNPNASVRMPILTAYRDGGVMLVGKVEAGTVSIDQQLLLQPNNVKVKVLGVRSNEEEYVQARPGENVELRISGIEEDSVRKGSVLCGIDDPVPVCSIVEVQLVIVEMLEHRPLITLGYTAVMHAHTLCEEVELMRLIESTDKATKKKKKNPAFIKQGFSATCVLKLANTGCLEPFSKTPQLGRFTLRDEGKTIAIGKIMKVLPSDMEF